MKLKETLKFIAAASRVFMTIMIFLLALFILQAITIELIEEAELAFEQKTAKKEVEKSWEELTEAEKQLKIIRNSSKKFLPDGTFLQVCDTSKHLGKYYRAKKNEDAIIQIYDINGTMVWEGKRKENPHEYLTWPSRSNSFLGNARIRHYRTVNPELSHYMEIPVRSQGKTLEIWRYNWEKEYFVGYSTEGGKLGYIGSEGFTGSKPNVEPFGLFKCLTAWCPQDSYSPTLLWQTKRKIYQIDFQQRQIKLLFESTLSDIAEFKWQKWGFDTEEPEGQTIDYRPTIHCKTEDGKHYLIMKDPQQRIAVNTPEDWKEHFVQLIATTKDIFLFHRASSPSFPREFINSLKLVEQWRKENRDKSRIYREELYKVDDTGDIEAVNSFGWTMPVRKSRFSTRDMTRRYVNSTSAIFYDLVYGTNFLSLWQKHRRSDNLVAVCFEMVNMGKPDYSILSWVLSAAMMVIAFLHGWPRRTNLAKLIFWVIFVGLFNLAGILTYLALNHTTVIKCHACGKRRGLEKTGCVRCSAALPAPAKRKTDLILKT